MGPGSSALQKKIPTKTENSGQIKCLIERGKYIYMHIYVYIYTHIHIYIHIVHVDRHMGRLRERERESWAFVVVWITFIVIFLPDFLWPIILLCLSLYLVCLRFLPCVCAHLLVTWILANRPLDSWHNLLWGDKTYCCNSGFLAEIIRIHFFLVLTENKCIKRY